MSKISFGDNSIPVETTVETPTPAAPPAEQLPVPYSARFKDEDVDLNDIILPRLNLVHRVGDLSARFEPGSYVLRSPDAELVLPRPIHIINVAFGPMEYVEKVEGGKGGLLCKSEAQVAEVGGTTDFNLAKRLKKSYFQPMRTSITAIQRADTIEPGLFFLQEFEGNQYCLALWSNKGSAYTHAVKGVFNTQSKLGLTRVGGHISHSWFLDSRLQTFKTGNVALVPVVKPAAPVPIELQTFLRELIFGAPQA